MNQSADLLIKTKSNASAKAAALQRKESSRVLPLVDNRPASVFQRKRTIVANLAGKQELHNEVTVPGSDVIQRKVFKNRFKAGYRSTLTKRDDYPTEEAAIAAEDAYWANRHAEEEAEHPQEDFEFQAPQAGPPVPETPLATALLAHPVHFGPVITRGGDVSTQQANAYAQKQVFPPDRNTAFSARNTHAMVFSNDDDEVRVHSHTGEATPLDEVEQKPPAEFYDQHVFKQGAAPPHVHLPDRRKKAHAEAHAVHSDAFESAVERNAADMMEMAGAADFDEGIGISAEPTDAELANLAAFVSIPHVGTQIALNRASCGHRGGSGHTGGCNQEMAESAQRYQDSLSGHMPASFAYVAQQAGIASFGVSTAGPYNKQGNPSIMTNHGVDVDVHNSFDWNTGQGNPISKEQQEYLAAADAAKARERKQKRLKKRDAPPGQQRNNFDPPPPPPPSEMGY